ncbi:MAG: TIGR04255 family protein, partial [Candidatus Aminicenantes bacterium]|nr:TIGR04255 family protein [Candidatus Aminicenantes bacterium]
MEQYPILRNAPITEALVDIRVKAPPQADVKTVDSMHELIKSRYPKKQEQRMSEIKIELKPGEELAKQLTKINGFRYLSSDEKEIVQARMDGFTFNKLFPYTKWEDLRNEAHRLWLIYREKACP